MPQLLGFIALSLLGSLIIRFNVRAELKRVGLVPPPVEGYQPPTTALVIMLAGFLLFAAGVLLAALAGR